MLSDLFCYSVEVFIYVKLHSVVIISATFLSGVFIANTDTRWYLNFTSCLYRFIPTIIAKDDIGRYHGNNERISVAHYNQAVNFYYRIIRNADLLIQQVPPTSRTKSDEKEL